MIGLFVSFADADGEKIPSWIKLTAGYWINGDVSDDEFLSALQFLVDKGILVIPNDGTDKSEKSTLPEIKTNDVPALVPEYINVIVRENSSSGIDIDIMFYDDSGRTPSDGNFVKDSGQAYIQIICDACSKSVFSKGFTITEDSFKWTTFQKVAFFDDLDGDYLTSKITIPEYQMNKGDTSYGTVYVDFNPTVGNSYETVEIPINFIPRYTQDELELLDYQENAFRVSGSWDTETLDFSVKEVGIWDGADYGTALIIQMDLVNEGRSSFSWNPQDLKFETCNRVWDSNCNTVATSHIQSSVGIGDTIEGKSNVHQEFHIYPTAGADVIYEKLKKAGKISFILYHDSTERKHSVVIYFDPVR